MQTLKKNIEGIYGEQGRRWLANLPHIVHELAIYWQLNQIMPVDNMTFNYVAKAITNNNELVVLKIGCDENAINEEKQALDYFDGKASIKLIAYKDTYHALLLQQAIPGITLKSLYSSQPQYVMACYVDTMRKLHNKSLSHNNSYRHIKDWLWAIDNLTEDMCPPYLLKKAVLLKNQLLDSLTTEVFLHGDLHHDNILKHGDQWLAIDPKGVVGEPEFEIAAFDFMYVNELSNEKNKKDAKSVFEARGNLLAQKADLNPQRIKDWVFVRLILMAAWHIQDNCDPSWAIKLAESFT